MKRLFVGNISNTVDEYQLMELFEEYGEVKEVNFIRHGETGEPSGFAHVTMYEDTEADEAIIELNGIVVNNQRLNVSEERMPRSRY